MASSPITEALVESNKEYAASFTSGDLALPPAKKYTIGTYSTVHPTPSVIQVLVLCDCMLFWFDVELTVHALYSYMHGCTD